MTVTYLTLVIYLLFFFFKQKTAYEMRISDWSSDVCSSDLVSPASAPPARRSAGGQRSAARDRRPPAAQPRDDGQPDPAQPGVGDPAQQIGRASCRERVCQYV